MMNLQPLGDRPIVEGLEEEDRFVHHSNIAGDGYKSLSEGARVEYEQQEGAKGPEATNVAPMA